ncbi:MAG: dihydroorotase [Vampirovibrionales bacterium]|nr:dihydroorotase [Vampirovibrionales bacterium]
MTALLCEAPPPVSTLLRGGRVLNPASGLDAVCDVLLRDGEIAAIGPDLSCEGVETVIELAPRHWVTPGLVDIHVHFRDPGRPDKETTASGAAAAIAGGFTTVCIMPNTTPTLDDLPTLAYVNQAARAVPITIHPVPAATKGLAGEAITEMRSLYEQGAVGFTDDGRCIMNANVMRLALSYSQMLNVPIMCHAEDYSLVGGGCMNEGYFSTLLGVKGHPNTAESVIVARDIELARQTGGHLHICHLSTREAVALVRQAKREGLRVTAEATPHHLTLTDAALQGYDPDFKMCPPLRAEEDRQALIAGLLDGTIDAIATDHAPHTPDEKALSLDEAPNGVVGLETAVGVLLTHLVKTGIAPPLRLIELMTLAPARLLNLSAGDLRVGARADVAVIDSDARWRVDPAAFKSRSRNSCFKGMALEGRPMMTFAAGRCLMDARPVMSAAAC